MLPSRQGRQERRVPIRALIPQDFPDIMKGIPLAERAGREA